MKALTIIALLISNCYLSLAAVQLQATSVTLDANQVTPPMDSTLLDSELEWPGERVTKLYNTGDDSCRAFAQWKKGWTGGNSGPNGQKMTTIKDGQFWAERSFTLELTLSTMTVNTVCSINTVTYRHKLIGSHDRVEVYDHGRRLLAEYSYNHLMAALGVPIETHAGGERRLQGVGNNQNLKSAMVTLKCTGCSIGKIKFVQSATGQSFKTDQYSFGFETKQSPGTVLPAVEVEAFPELPDA